MTNVESIPEAYGKGTGIKRSTDESTKQAELFATRYAQRKSYFCKLIGQKSPPIF